MKLFNKHKAETLSQAKSLYAKGHFKKALSACKDLINKNPNDFEAYNLLGDIHYKMGNKSKAIEVYRNLAEKLEEDKFTERAIAVTRKIIRFFPDQLDLYRKISKLYSKKGLLAEHVNVLYELSNIYEERGEKDKAVDILKEIAEYNRSNAENYYNIILKFDKYGKQQEVNRFIYHAFELADKYNKEQLINNLVDTAIKNDCDLTNCIKFIIPYYKDTDEHKELFSKYGKNYLHENFDESFFSDFVEFLDYDDDPEFFEEIKDKYNHIAIYNYLLQYTINHRSYDETVKLLEEIADLPKYNFDNSVMNIIEKNYSSLDNTEILDAMAIISEKCEDRDTIINLYKHLKDIYNQRGDNERADNLEQFISDLEKTGFNHTNDFEVDEEDVTQSDDVKDFGDLLEQTSFEDMGEKSENLLDSIDVDLQEEMEDEDIFGLELNNTDIGESTEKDSEEEDSDLDIEFDLNDLDSGRNSGDEDESGFDNESAESLDNISGLEHNEQSYSDKQTSETEKNDEESESLDELEDFDLNEMNEGNIFSETPVEQESEDSNVEAASESKETKIEKIKQLIDRNDFDTAHSALDELLQNYPDDEEIKNLATELILFSEEGESEEVIEEKSEDINSLTSEFKDVAKSIRESINEMIDPGDYETHYNMAMAYMEMELYDDAITELKKSATSNKRYESLYLMAECYKLLGNYDQSINIHKLIVVDYSDKERMLNSLYEIAHIYEISGNAPVALNYYKKVFFLDESFRDVKAKIDNPDSLGSSPSSETKVDSSDDNNLKEKKKISYL
ncbi:Tetratricopeptide TPR_2 repeat-containing protein [Flexistipes sinusarabici DSM 4947]|uniref:Tetratricopeptide TPR_2 repeat-containing protein n=1 Tax=Flexistipes sinusarabici (strain ATCC 49648 / DSM 4947 / MAS 10) TaxID=717231 RepID=F8E704_FLESM|nr:tetratricopeptide repeat protein [Flexistipes sinusarabici]AEI14867.1 Tetratricopeptide TPR_2 repeat-containing protein [Flexistipes sinusarabici DSM 4947]